MRLTVFGCAFEVLQPIPQGLVESTLQGFHLCVHMFSLPRLLGLDKDAILLRLKGPGMNG
jgi:hypothetical protein